MLTRKQPQNVAGGSAGSAGSAPSSRQERLRNGRDSSQASEDYEHLGILEAPQLLRIKISTTEEDGDPGVAIFGNAAVQHGARSA